MKFFSLCLVFVTGINFHLSAQTTLPQVQLNNGIDTTNSVYNAIYDYWKQYLNIVSINADTPILKNYWAPSEISKYKTIDLISHDGFFSQGFYSFPTQKLILSITKTQDSTYIIRTACYHQNENNVINILGIINVGITINNGQYKLVNYLSVATNNWKNKVIGHINFLYPQDYVLNEIEAKKSSDFLDSIYHFFNITPRPVLYVVGKSCDEIMQIRGFDYIIGMGGDNKICGVFDSKNFIAYGGGLGAYYPHELVHVVNAYFRNSHELFLIGLSGLWGGHFGKPIIYHAKRVLDFLDKKNIHEIDPLTFTQMDEYTAPCYVTGALLCKKILEKGGVSLLEKAMSYGTNSDDFYKAVNDILGIDKNKLPKYLVNELHKWVKETN